MRKEVNDVFDAQQILFAERLANSDLGHMLLEQADQIKLPRHSLKKKYDDDAWRIFWQPVDNGELIIAVGQELDYREDLIEDMILGQMWIWFASLPLLILVLAWLIRKELRPIQRLSQEVSSRKSGDVSLLNTQSLPAEILPLVQNLNQFFDRTSMLQRECRFISDAAHELHSPLAALRIQTEVAQLAGDDETLRNQALSRLTQGIDRASQLIEQLLTLSKLDNLQELDELQPLDWEGIIQSLIAECYFTAEKRQIRLMFDKLADPTPKQGQPILISLMLRNLLDNAIKYCPEGAMISVKMTASQIIVEDNGGGVDPDNLKKLGQCFYRPAGQNEKGSGLGLSIVMRIAELHGLKVRLENVEEQGSRVGLRAIISL